MELKHHVDGRMARCSFFRAVREWFTTRSQCNHRRITWRVHSRKLSNSDKSSEFSQTDRYLCCFLRLNERNSTRPSNSSEFNSPWRRPKPVEMQLQKKETARDRTSLTRWADASKPFLSRIRIRLWRRYFCATSVPLAGAGMSGAFNDRRNFNKAARSVRGSS